MSYSLIASTIELFETRLSTLEAMIKKGDSCLAEPEEDFLTRRIAADMFPLGTQIAFTCNQPRNFALWLDGKPSDNFESDVLTMEKALGHISETKQMLNQCPNQDEALPAQKHLPLGPGLHADLTGPKYIQDFLIPNFYFHLCTSYAILRNAGVPLGKKDYMLHLLPDVIQSDT